MFLYIALLYPRQKKIVHRLGFPSCERRFTSYHTVLVCHGLFSQPQPSVAKVPRIPSCQRFRSFSFAGYFHIRNFARCHWSCFTLQRCFKIENSWLRLLWTFRVISARRQSCEIYEPLKWKTHQILKRRALLAEKFDILFNLTHGSLI